MIKIKRLLSIKRLLNSPVVLSVKATAEEDRGRMARSVRHLNSAAVVAAEAAAVEAANPTPAAPQKPAVAVGHDPNMALSRRAVEAEVAGQVGRHDAVEAESGVGELVFADEKGEVTVTVRVPAATKAKHVRCVVKEQHLTLEVSTLPAGQTLVVNGELFQKVDVDGCNWMVEDDKAKGRLLQLTLTKAVQMTWLMLVRS